MSRTVKFDRSPSEVDRLPCLSCGQSHSKENRQRILARMLEAGESTQEIREMWPCFWPQDSAGERRFYRDRADVWARRAA